MNSQTSFYLPSLSLRSIWCLLMESRMPTSNLERWMADISGPHLGLALNVARAFAHDSGLARVSSMYLILVCTGDSGRSSHRL